ncbi:phosphotransferase family protein [Paenibacillus sp. MCAF20]
MIELTLIGRGATADVYDWHDGLCLKLFNKGNEASALKEFAITSSVARLGVHLAEPHEIIDYEGRTGIVYDKIEGTPLNAAIEAEPDALERFGAIFANIHLHVHQAEAPELSSPLEELITLIRNDHSLTLLESQKKKLLAFVQQPLEKSLLCHFDFHPFNILVSIDTAYVIDWMNARAFHPLADVAMTSVILQVAGFPLELVVPFHKRYVSAYLEGSSYSREELLYWEIVLALARLSEQKPNEALPIRRLIARNVDSLGL